MTSSGPTDFVRKNQQHIQQLMLQRQHEHSLAEAAVLAESRQRQKLREKVLSMREEKWSSSLPSQNGEKPRTLDHSETMPYAHSSTSKVTSPLRRCLSAANNVKQVILLPLIIQICGRQSVCSSNATLLQAYRALLCSL